MSITRRFGALLLIAATLSACWTGERPSFAEPPVGGEPGSSTGDPAVDVVLQKLETSQQSPITATYTITRNLGPVQTAALLSQDSSRRSLTIGNIRFLTLGSEQTCDLVTGTCESGLNDARVSDTGVSEGFPDDVPARRLRVSAARESGPAQASTETVAGNPAVCATVPLDGGAEVYCATDYGVIARWVAADVTVQLDSVTPAADERYFSTTPS